MDEKIPRTAKIGLKHLTILNPFSAHQHHPGGGGGWVQVWRLMKKKLPLLIGGALMSMHYLQFSQISKSTLIHIPALDVFGSILTYWPAKGEES